jgi:hypothetical protein
LVKPPGVRLVLAAAGALLLGCGQIWDLPDRELDPRVTCARGSCTCAAGFGDCDGDQQNGCEAELEANDRHCGACGRDCQGGACSSGRCQPVPVITASGVTGLAIDATHVYWTTGGSSPQKTIQRVSRAGGQADLLRELNEPLGPAWLRVRGGHLYWAEGADIVTQPVGGGARRTLTTAAEKVSALVVHEPYVYFVIPENVGYVGSDAVIERVPIAGGASQRLFPRDRCWSRALEVDGERAYWLEACYADGVVIAGRVVMAPVEGGDPTVVAGPAVQALAADDQNLYWLERDQPDSGVARDTLWKMPKQGGSPSTLAPDQFETTQLASVGSHVFWTANAPVHAAGAASLMKVSALGGPTEELARTSIEPFVNIVVDKTTLFWATPERIMKLAH